MPRRPPLALLLALLAACSSPDDGPLSVEPVPALASQVVSVCAEVTRDLPQEVASGVARRAVEPDDRVTAAWGDPAVVLRCGTPEGSPTDDPYEFDGVRWAMHDIGAARRWTTRARAVNVEVVIPDAYSGQAELLGGLARALAPTAR